MHIISVPDKVEKTFSLLRTFIEATNSKIISDIIVIKVKDDCSIGNKRLIQTMFKDEFLVKFKQSDIDETESTLALLKPKSEGK